jgi:hypothetical protein
LSKLRDSQIPVGPARTRWGRWVKPGFRKVDCALGAAETNRLGKIDSLADRQTDTLPVRPSESNRIVWRAGVRRALHGSGAAAATGCAGPGQDEPPCRLTRTVLDTRPAGPGPGPATGQENQTYLSKIRKIGRIQKSR